MLAVSTGMVHSPCSVRSRRICGSTCASSAFLSALYRKPLSRSMLSTSPPSLRRIGRNGAVSTCSSNTKPMLNSSALRWYLSSLMHTG